MLPFVFLDAQNRPFRLQLWGDQVWLFRWNGTDWVSMHRVTQSDVWQFERDCLEIPLKDADKLYPIRG